MSTKARVGVDITARDMSASAFGAVNRRLAAFERGILSTQRVLQGFAAAAPILAMGRALKSAVDRMDEMGKAAQRMGVGVESLSRLNLAAKLSDVTLESLGGAVSKLNKNLAAIAGGDSKSPAARALAALGVSATDASGRLKNADTVMSEVADRFSRMQDGAGKSALAIAVFGKTGADLIPMLNGGSQALREAAAEAERTGQAFGASAAANAEMLNDNVTRLWGRVEGFSNLLAQKMVPDLIDLSEQLLQVADSASIAAMALAEWDKFKRDAGTFWETTKGEFAAVKRLAGGVSEAFDAKTFGEAGDILANAWGGAKTEMQAAAKAAEMLRQSVDRTGKGSLPTDMGGSGKKTTRSAAPFGWASSDKANTVDRERNKLLAEAKNLYESVRSPAQEYADTVARLDMLKAKGLISMETYSRALFKAKFAFEESKVVATEATEEFFNLGDAIKGAFESNFASVIDGTMKVGKAFKKMGTDILQTAATTMANKLFGQFIDAIFGGNALYGGGGFLSSLFGGGRAAGGPVEAGKTYMVGENGPELLRMGSAGNVTPNHALGGSGGVAVNIVLNAEGADRTALAALRADLNRMASTIGTTIKSTVQKEFGANPKFMRA